MSMTDAEREIRAALAEGPTEDWTLGRFGVIKGGSLQAENARLREALTALFAADMEHVLMGDGKDDQIEAIAKAIAALQSAQEMKS